MYVCVRVCVCVCVEFMLNETLLECVVDRRCCCFSSSAIVCICCFYLTQSFMNGVCNVSKGEKVRPDSSFNYDDRVDSHSKLFFQIDWIKYYNFLCNSLTCFVILLRSGILFFWLNLIGEFSTSFHFWKKKNIHIRNTSIISINVVRII